MTTENEFPHLKRIAEVISSFGRVYNGFEAHGVENIPKEGPALLVFYHGLVPIDAWYFGLNYYLETGRLIRGLGDDWLFKTPGMAWLCRAVGGVPGRPEVALQFLREGNLVAVSPGGVREAIKGDQHRYTLMWGKRTGFARLALEAGVDIIPAFTQNVEETFRAPGAHHPFFQNLYEKTRLPLVPVLGFGPLPFPVKLRTHIGAPICAAAGETAESLRDKTHRAIMELIKNHQDPKSGILNALKTRFLK